MHILALKMLGGFRFSGPQSADGRTRPALGRETRTTRKPNPKSNSFQIPKEALFP